VKAIAKKGVEEEIVTNIGVDDLVTSTPLESDTTPSPKDPVLCVRPRATRDQTGSQEPSSWVPIAGHARSTPSG
jgi:hypothetical protein